MNLPALSAVLFSSCLIATTTAAWAQPRCGVAQPGAPKAWSPRVPPNYDADPPTAAERAVLETTGTAVEQLLKKTAYGVQRGFEAQAWWHHWPIEHPGDLREYEVRIVTWCPTSHLSPDGAAPVKVVINPDPGQWTQGRPLADAADWIGGVHHRRRKRPARCSQEPGPISRAPLSVGAARHPRLVRSQHRWPDRRPAPEDVRGVRLGGLQTVGRPDPGS